MTGFHMKSVVECCGNAVMTAVVSSVATSLLALG